MSVTNTHNIPSASSNLNNNRRELPNVPKTSMNIDNKSTSNTGQNPFYNPSTTTNNPTGISASRSTPSQWMGNIGQTLRRQTSNVVDVKKREFLPDLLINLFFLLGRW